VSPETRLSERDSNEMNRPSALIDGLVLSSAPRTPLPLTETRVVEGMHPVAPAHVSRRKTSAFTLVSPGTRFAAEDVNDTNLPSELIAGVVPGPTPWLPSLATDTRVIDGVHADEVPRHVSRTNTSLKAFVSPGTRFPASDENAMKRPSGLIAPTP